MPSWAPAAARLLLEALGAASRIASDHTGGRGACPAPPPCLPPGDCSRVCPQPGNCSLACPACEPVLPWLPTFGLLLIFACLSGAIVGFAAGSLLAQRPACPAARPPPAAETLDLAIAPPALVAQRLGVPGAASSAAVPSSA